MMNEKERELSENLKVKVPQDVITWLASIISDEVPMGLAVYMVSEILEGIPEGASSEKIIAVLQEQLVKPTAEEKKNKPGNAKAITRRYFDSLLLEQRLMDPAVPSTEFALFGETFASPIMTAALSHLGASGPSENGPMENYAKGAYDAGCVHWIGMAENDAFESVCATGARTIRIIKPYADEGKIISQLQFAEECHALAVGMDIDHVFTGAADIDVVMGERMEIKSGEKLRAYADVTDLPFIVKGVLSVRDAARCAELGFDGIVVSHHGGKMNYAVPPLMILPDILKEVGDSMAVFVDCGIVSGMDAYKALALGAKGVSVGTHLIPYVRKGHAAVTKRLNAMNDELKGIMVNTGVPDLNSFDPDVIHFGAF